MGNLKYPLLFQPLTLAGRVFRNRIFGSPTGWQDLSGECFPSPECAAYYERKARGGAATVTVGEMAVDTRRGQGAEVAIPLDNPSAAPSLTRLAEGISRRGAVAVAELQHAGMFAEESARRGNVIYGPVARERAVGGIVHADGGGAVLEMPERVIYETIEAYADAAAFARKCGFGMVLIHGGHGWLLSQFLSPQINVRRDDWGGSLENRVRLPLAIIKRIKEKCGARFPVEFRISATEANPDGYGLDEGVKIAVALDGKADLIHCSAGHHEVRAAFVVTHPSLFAEDGVNAYLAREIKKHVKTPVAAVGGFTEPELMEETLRTGGADVIAVARELIADPDMPNKARAGREADVTRCLRCFTCFSSVITNRTFCCAVNPEIGAETVAARNEPPERRKKVLVAGGGVAGIEAALTAAARGHDVTLCEKSDRLGGTLRCEENVPFKSKLSAYLDQQERRVLGSGIDLRLNTEVTRELAADEKPDAIIAALGAEPLIPKIDGIGRAILAEDVYRDSDLAGKTVAILGGGLVGVELAIFLAQQGRSVTVLEMLPRLSDGGNELHGLALDLKLREVGVTLSLSTRAVKITASGVEAERGGEVIVFPADTVICAVGQSPRSAAAQSLYDVAPEFHMIGDCVSPRNIREAVRQGYFAALDL
ncbi:MAG: NAD(P)/FAD-dependent oxidoreductase [Oscillospiraceae bacterium]|jgi:2,4-dienoyl-CoA reductase-like NADH-dependent reductase (Old Yellow Enzyme family)/thioredoxin reductase|nr:NAD(P)/FAD-dependent oxidoreductase [Oscillospiraceae bacterium]